jgi:hypothetical protein
VIKRLRTVLVARGVFSRLDQRMKVDRYTVAYACPPDVLHDSDHEWLAEFEVRRGRRFEPPAKFADKWEAHQYAEQVLRERGAA